MDYQFDWNVLLNNRELLYRGLVGTINLFAPTLVTSTLLGVAISILRTAWKRAWPLTVLVEMFRNIPPVVQLFFWAFAVGLDAFTAGFIGLTIFTSVYISEVFRSGIESVPKTQVEAALSSGLRGPQIWVHILLPQAFLKMIPALSIEYITLLKNTSIAMTIAYIELTFVTQEIESETFRGFEAATAVTAIYIVLCMSVAVGMYVLEHVSRANLRSVR